MKSSLFTTLLAVTTMTLLVLTARSAGLRGLQSVSVQPGSLPSFKLSGLGNLLNILNSATEFTNSTFDVLTLDSFSQNNTDDGVVYQGVITLANDQGYNVTGLLSGVWDSANNNLAFNVSQYVAPAESEGSEGDNGTGIDNSTNSTSNTSVEVNTTNPDNSTNITITIPVPAGYTYIAPEDVANNSLAQGALDFGVDALIAKAISQYKLPAADPEYNVTNLYFAAWKNASFGNAFVFYTNLTNDLDYKVDANLTLRYFSANQSYSLAGYSFRSYNYPAGAIVIPQNNASNSTSNSTNNATDNSTAPSNVTIITPDNTTTIIIDNSTNSSIPDNTTVIVDNSTVVDTNTSVPVNVTLPESNVTANASNATSPSNNTSSANQTTADGYTIYTAAQLANDSIAQGALQYGAKALIQTGVNQNKIPAANANYTINNVTLASYKRVVLGTYYRFNVNMTNVDLVHVDASLTVLYRYSTKAYSLNGYSFRSYNYSSSALSNNVTTTPIVNSTNATAPVANSTNATNNTRLL